MATIHVPRKHNDGLVIGRMTQNDNWEGLLRAVQSTHFNLERVYATYKAGTEPLLHYAARTGRKELLDAVLSKMEPCEEGEVDHLLNQRFRNCTALEAAKRAGHMECIEALLAANAE